MEWLQWPFLKAPMERALSQAAGRDVRFGDRFGVRLIGPVRLRSNETIVANPPDWPHTKDGDHFLLAKDALLVLDWSTVLGLRNRDAEQPLQVRELDVGHLDLALLRMKDGKANWTFGKPDSDDAAQQNRKRAPLPEVGRMLVREGTVTVRDEVLQLDATASVSTREGGGYAQPGADTAGGVDPADSPTIHGLKVQAKGTYRGEPLQISLSSAGGILPVFASAANTPAVPVTLEVRSGQSRLHFEGSVRDLFVLGGLDGDVQIKGRSLAELGRPIGVTLPNTESFDTSAHIRKEGELWKAEVKSLAVGSSRLHGNFELDRSGKVPKLSGTLAGKRLALPDLGPAFRGGGETGKHKQPAGKLLPAAEFDIPSLAVMNADVDVNVEVLDLGTQALAALQPLKAHVTLQDSELAVAQIDTRASGGRVRGEIRMNAREKVPQWKTDLNVAGVQLQQFIKSRGRSADGPMPYISGALSGRARFSGAGRSTAAMLASLDGHADLWVRNGGISHLLLEAAGIDIAQALGVMMSGDRRLPMECAVTRFSVKDGVGKPEVALIDTTDSTLYVSGQLSLASEQLDLLLHAQPKDFSPLSLRAPVHIEGTFAHPKVRVDVGSVAVKAGVAAVLAAIAAPAAALLALIDVGSRDKDVCGHLLQDVSKGRRTLRAGPDAPAEGKTDQTAKPPASPPASRSSTPPPSEGPTEDLHKYIMNQ